MQRNAKAGGLPDQLTGAGRAPTAALVLGAGVPVILTWAFTTVPPALIALTTGLGFVLLLLAWFDATSLRLPDLLTLPLTAVGLLAGGILSGQPQDHLLGAVAGFGVCVLAAVLHRRWRGTEGLGFGDAKLAAAGGAWLGWAAVPAMLLLACLGAGLWLAIIAAARGKAALGQPLPFGIPLAAAIWVIWLYGPF